MKTLYVDIDEEIAELLKKISAVEGRQILLVVPKNAVIFRNSIHLKLLQKKASDLEKDLQVFTNYPQGRLMLEKLGIKQFQGYLRKRKNQKTTKFGKVPQEIVRQTERKVSITDISESNRKIHVKASLSSAQKLQQKKEQRRWGTIFLINTLRKKTVLAFTVLSLLFFGFVFYIVVPSATIYLTPASNVIEATVNITVADLEKEAGLFRNPRAHVIKALPIELIFEKNILHKPTGKIFTGQSARCNLKIENNRSTPWALVARTRFQDTTGVVFRTRDQVEVPAARYQVVRDEQGVATQQKVPGSLIVGVEADEFDDQGIIIGSRGNLPADTHFILPGLSEFNQNILDARNEKACLGGVTEFYSIVTEEDLAAAEQKMEDELGFSARQYLIDYVEGENIKRAELQDQSILGSELILFDDTQAISYEILEVSLPPNLKNQKIEEFSVHGQMRVRGVAYEKQPYYEILEENLIDKVHPSKVLSKIDYDSATYHLVYSDSNLNDFSKIKLSVTVRGIEHYNFDPRSDRGKELIDKVLDYVAGRPKIDATYFIANLEEIQAAHISIWPFWKTNLPDRRSSITIKVQ